MRKLVLSSVGVVCLSLAVACSSSSPDQGKDPGNNNGAAGATGSGGSGGGSNNAPYPAGPFGAEIGSTMRNLQFQGWRDPSAAGYTWAAQPETISLSDYYNPDGSKPAKVLMINVSARWCTVCKGEYADFKFSGDIQKYSAEGVVFIGVLFEDDNYAAAKPADMEWWTKAYSVSFPFVLDPGFKMGEYFSADATPLNMIVDAKTMQIKGKVLGYDPSQPDLWNQLDSALASQ